MKNKVKLKQLSFVIPLVLYAADLLAMDGKLPEDNISFMLTLGSRAFALPSANRLLDFQEENLIAHEVSCLLGVLSAVSGISIISENSLKFLLEAVEQNDLVSLERLRRCAQRITVLDLSNIPNINSGHVRKLSRIFTAVNSLIICSDAPLPAGGIFLSVPLVEAIIESYPLLNNLTLQDIQFRETPASFAQREKAEAILRGWKTAQQGRAFSLSYRDS